MCSSYFKILFYFSVIALLACDSKKNTSFGEAFDYNWKDCTSPDVLKQFEKETGTKVVVGELVKKEQRQLILMEQQMSKPNGFQASDAIKSRPSIKDIPIITTSLSLADVKKTPFTKLLESYDIFKELTNYLDCTYNKKDFKERA